MQPEQNPWTLSFRDPELEAAYKAAAWDEQRQWSRKGYMLILFLLVSFGPVEYVLFPDRYGMFFLLRYGLVVPSLLVFGPLYMSARWDDFMSRHMQEVLFTSTLMVFVGVA